METMLELETVTVRYGKTIAAHCVSLKVARGEIVALVGANGAGKSSLLKGILGVGGQTSGTIRFAGKPVEHLAPHQRIRQGLALVPEGRHVFAQLTVADNLELGFSRGAKADLAPRIERMFGLFPILEKRSEQAAGTLSGGEQQMLAIARALMSAPDLLMLDEPTLGLAPMIVAKLGELLRNLRDQGQTILLSEQNARMSLATSDRAYVLSHGEIVQQGQSSVLCDSAEIRKAYLGL
jgi:branched-chain amino acid transport system ATP-binding protein